MLLVKLALLTSLLVVANPLPQEPPSNVGDMQIQTAPNRHRAKRRHDVDGDRRKRRSSYFNYPYAVQVPVQWPYHPASLQTTYVDQPYVLPAAVVYPVIFLAQPPYAKPCTTATTPSPPDNPTMSTVFDRFNFDDRPIWDYDPSNEVPQEVATRAPPRRTTQPPIQHGGGRQSNTFNHLSADDTVTRLPPPKTTTSRPPPKTTTSRPTLPTPGPNECVWAIISCCSSSSEEVSLNCFEQLGCGGPFWDVSPCRTEFAKAAIATANNYFNMGRKR